MGIGEQTSAEDSPPMAFVAVVRGSFATRVLVVTSFGKGPYLSFPSYILLLMGLMAMKVFAVRCTVHVPTFLCLCVLYAEYPGAFLSFAPSLLSPRLSQANYYRYLTILIP